MEENNINYVAYFCNEYQKYILNGKDKFLINEDKIIFVKLNNEVKSTDYTKVKYKCGWFWNRKTKVGYQMGIFRYLGLIKEEYIHKVLFEDEERHDLFIKDDGEVYVKPRIHLCFSDGNKIILYYDTYEDAKIDFDNIKKKYPKLNTLGELVNGFTINNFK